MFHCLMNLKYWEGVGQEFRLLKYLKQVDIKFEVNLREKFIQVKLTKISYIGTLFIVRFIQDFVLFSVLFIQVSRYNVYF